MMQSEASASLPTSTPSMPPSVAVESPAPVSPMPNGGRRWIGSFNLLRHLAQTGRADSAKLHIKIGIQNWLTTQMMRAAQLTAPGAPERLQPRTGQFRQIEKELGAYAPKDKHTRVLIKLPLLGGLRRYGIKFGSAIEAYPNLDFPNYYLQPFHSLPGGWLNPVSMTGSRAAMRALFDEVHPGGMAAVRELIAKLVPADSKVVYDFGASIGDQVTTILRNLGPDARAYCIEPSPYGHVVGKHLHSDERMRWIYDFVENTPLEENSADVVNIMFVLHECPDHIKRTMLERAYHVLRPGGRLIITEPPMEDLVERARGFFEPYRDQWYVWNVDRQLDEVGFRSVHNPGLVDPFHMWTRVAIK